MVLEIRRTYLYVGRHESEWYNADSYTVPVWQYGTEGSMFKKPSIPPNYVRGLLRCYYYNRLVTLEEFDKHLARLGLSTRDEIQKMLRA